MSDNTEAQRVEPFDTSNELRRSFHQHLDDTRDRIASLAAIVTENIPRATHIRSSPRTARAWCS